MQTIIKKPWYKSKTIWFNAISAGMIAFEASMHLIQPQITPSQYLGLISFMAVGNTLLRAITTHGIEK